MGRLRRIWSFLTRPEVYWRLFSLLLAVIFWLLAAGDGSLGGTERVITLNVEVHNLSSDLVLVDPPVPVRVRIRGLSPILNRGEEAIRARIDLAGSVEGTETHGVEVEAPVGIEVVSVTPRWVSVNTELLGGQVFPVTLALLGVDPANLMTTVNPVPPVVTVIGPSSILERVDHVVAYVTLGQNFVDLEDSFPVQALDAQGRSLAPLEIDPAKIQVKLEHEEVPEQVQDPSGEE